VFKPIFRADDVARRDPKKQSSVASLPPKSNSTPPIFSINTRKKNAPSIARRRAFRMLKKRNETP